MAIQIPPEMLISDMFDLSVRNLTQDVLSATAPAVFADALTAKYLVATEDGIIHAIESGDDPLRPMSLDAPARRIQRGMEERTLLVEKYFETVFANRVKAADLERGVGVDIVQKAVRDLAALHKDRLEWKIADIYNNSANFGATPSLDFTSATEVEIIDAIGDAIDGVRPSNSLSDEYGVSIVVGRSVMTQLRRALAVVLERPNVQSAGTASAITDVFGAGVRIFASQSQYIDNATAPATPVRKSMWSDSLLAVVANSSDIAVPSFAVTAIWDQTSKDQMADTANADIDPRFASVYYEEVLNPRGTNIYAESFFKTEVVNPNRGAKFSVTLPS